VSLGVFQNFDITAYMRGGKFATGETGGQPTWLLGRAGATRNSLKWLDRLGLWQADYVEVGVRAGIARIDPLGIDSSSAAIKRIALGNNQFFHLGAYVPSSGAQNMYSIDDIGFPGDPFNLVDYNQPDNITTPNVFPNVSAESNTVAGFGSGDVGWYDTNSDTDWLFFEGWDHDSSGNTVGTALITNSACRDATALYTEISALVNLTTGFATPLLGLPSLYKTSPDNAGQSGSLFGEARVEFDSLQFLPDDDSRANAPKGQLLLSSSVTSSGDSNNYLRFVEWNPEALAGTPTRVHLRERLVTRATFDLEASNASFPGLLSNEVPSTASGVGRIKVNRQTGRPCVIYTEEGGSGAEFFTTWNFHSTIMEMSLAPVTAEMTKPSPRQNVETNRIVIVGSEAVGDLGERVAGQDVDWTLERQSTAAEVMNTPPTPPAGPYTVAHVPIDRNSNFPFEIRKDGVPLVETTDYTVNEALGQITWAGGEPFGASAYVIDYAHPTNPATPPFGQLLVSASVTDEDGEAFTRVKYSDTPADEGHLDTLTVTTS
jgi:hypothetical protein